MVMVDPGYSVYYGAMWKNRETLTRHYMDNMSRLETEFLDARARLNMTGLQLYQNMALEYGNGYF